MRIEPLGIEGAWLVDPEPAVDDRGYFARVFDREVFELHGIPTGYELWALSQNVTSGTLRGLHYQRAPHAEAKIVRCARGRLFDVVVDLRPASSTYLEWRGCELDQDSARSLVVPRGCAHGFLTLADDTIVHYSIDRPYEPSAADGLRWDDPTLGIDWPTRPTVVSRRDQDFPDLAGRLADGLGADE